MLFWSIFAADNHVVKLGEFRIVVKISDSSSAIENSIENKSQAFNKKAFFCNYLRLSFNTLDY